MRSLRKGNINMIKTLQDYINKIEKITNGWGGYSTTTHPWFRGQSDEKWDLIPKIYRKNEKPEYEREMVRDFKLRASAYIENSPKNDMEWLFLMQHYGMPTRLLDWTESYLIALFFSVVSLSQENSTVWIIEPWSLNSEFFNCLSLPTSDDLYFNNYILHLDKQSIDDQRNIEGTFPIALRPNRNSPRIIAQKGTFTIHGKERISINGYITNKNVSTTKIKLEKIIIDGNYKKELLQQLFLAGVTHSTLFPELEGLSNEISCRYSRLFLG